ncbi:putative diguanylate cyclase YcdT [compost metagenome]
MVYDQLNNQIKAILLYTLVPFILLLLVTIWLARRLAQPFVNLAKIVSRIGQEEVSFPAAKQHWNREADWLTKTVILALNGIKTQTDQLTHEAMTDALTGLNNRRTMETIMKQWTEEQTPFSIIVLDIDHFKRVNDTYGHLAGDQVLQYLAEIVKQSVGPGDICSRYGGEEFVVLLPLVDAAAAYAVAERIRITMEKGENHLKQIITVSLGIAHYPTHTHVTDELFHLADQALYKAKHDGRNRTMIVESHS